MIEISDGQHSDLAELQNMLFETWHENFDASLGIEVVEAICQSTYSIEKMEQQLDAKSLTFLVARQSKKIIGHGLAHCKDQTLFIHRLYVSPKVQRAGVGIRLYQALRMAYADYGEVRLEVIESNPKARAFYDKLGFEVVGKMNECLGAANVPSLKMALKL